MNIFPIIEVDEKSGFCFGVINAIKYAEKELDKSNELYCLGDIVHNDTEVNRLERKGMKTINYEQLKYLNNKKVLFRAHGEPPSVYKLAKERNIDLVDATCPVVVQLQKKIKTKYQSSRDINAQIVIYGKKGHAEVNGLVGQTNGDAIVISNIEEVELLDMERPIILFSQTTQSLKTFMEIIEIIKSRISENVLFEYQDTICRQVSNRVNHIQEFASGKELVFFVAGAKSSNGKVLFEYCKKGNDRSIFLSSSDQLTKEMLMPMPKTIGICGATSTPMWQMQEVKDKIMELLNH